MKQRTTKLKDILFTSDVICCPNCLICFFVYSFFPFSSFTRLIFSQILCCLYILSQTGSPSIPPPPLPLSTLLSTGNLHIALLIVISSIKPLGETALIPLPPYPRPPPSPLSSLLWWEFLVNVTDFCCSRISREINKWRERERCIQESWNKQVFQQNFVKVKFLRYMLEKFVFFTRSQKYQK